LNGITGLPGIPGAPGGPGDKGDLGLPGLPVTFSNDSNVDTKISIVNKNFSKQLSKNVVFLKLNKDGWVVCHIC
jgi:hypothetical protein